MRVVHADPSCRICRATQPGLIATAGPLTEPYPNPYREHNPHGEPQGGPGGHHWYHGTRSGFQGDELRAPRGIKGEYGERAGEHWNTDLGVHFSSIHGVAKDEFAVSDTGRVDPDSRVAHASLHMRKPKHYESEDEMTHEAVGWAQEHGHKYLPEHPQAHKAFIHGAYDLVEDHDADEGKGRYYDYHEDHKDLEPHQRAVISDIDENGPKRYDPQSNERWLGYHPDREQITEGFRRHLLARGHDGITYGNSYEGPHGHTSAIAFPETPVTLHRWEYLHPDRKTAAAGGSGLNFEHTEESSGGMKRPTAITLRGLHPDTGEEVGFLRYLVPKRKADKIYVDRLEVHPEHKGNGYAGQIMDEMQRRHPKTPIDHGDRTEEGANWWKSYSRGKSVSKGRTIAKTAADDDYWKYQLPKVRTIHRGLPVELPPDVHALVHDPMQSRDRQARAIVEHLQSRGGVGSHWSANEKVSREFAKHQVQPGHTKVILHAHPPELEHVETDPDVMHEKGIFGHDNWLAGEKEIPLKEGAPVGVHSVTWYSGRRRYDGDIHPYGYTASRRTASIRMVPPEEYRKFSYPDYPRAKSPETLVKHFKRTSPEYFEKVKNDVQQNGFTTPVLVRYNDPGGRPLKRPVVMEGHHRAAVAHELGMHLPVGDYDDNDDFDTAHKAGQQWFRDNVRSTGDMPGKEGAYNPGGRFAYDEDRCPTCHGRGEDAEGHECGACDGSGRPSCPCGLQVQWDPLDGYQHLDGSISHDGKFYDKSVSDLMKQAKTWMPTKRLFGPTYGLDHRLFDGEHLKPDVRTYILGTLNAFWLPQYGRAWRSWARVYFAGSEASEWTSATLEGNNDFDVLVGVNYDRARRHVPSFQGRSNEEITERLNDGFRTGLDPRTDPAWIIVDGEKTGPWSNTWYVNPNSWDIREIRPYAAYDVTADRWAVKPPHLPEWDISKFPEGRGLSQEIRGVVDMARGILRMPEPYRTQQGAQFWHYIHDTRSRAFGPQGEGWYDPSNVLEKALDQAGLMQALWALMDKARQDPHALDAPAGWSNDPLDGAH